MANAPKPGQVRAQQANKNAKTELRLRLRDKTYSLFPYALPLKVRTAFRAQMMGQSLMGYLVNFDEVSMAAIIWACRVVDGESTLTVEEVFDELDLESLSDDDFELTEITPDKQDIAEGEDDPKD